MPLTDLSDADLLALLVDPDNFDEAVDIEASRRAEQRDPAKVPDRLLVRWALASPRMHRYLTRTAQTYHPAIRAVEVWVDAESLTLECIAVPEVQITRWVRPQNVEVLTDGVDAFLARFQPLPPEMTAQGEIPPLEGGRCLALVTGHDDDTVQTEVWVAEGGLATMTVTDIYGDAIPTIRGEGPLPQILLQAAAG